MNRSKKRSWVPKCRKNCLRILPLREDGSYDALESFKSMMPGNLSCYDEGVVAIWLSIFNRKYFENSKSGLYGYKQRCKAIAKHWLRHGRHSFGHNDPKIRYCQKLWNNHIKRYIKVEF